MGGGGNKIKGFFQKVGRGIKKAATWTWDKLKRVGKGIWKGVKWAGKNILPVVGKVVGAVTGGSSTVGKIARAAGAVGEVIGGKVGNKVQQGAGKVGQVSQKVGDTAQRVGNTVMDKGEKIKKIINNTAQSVVGGGVATA